MKWSHCKRARQVIPDLACALNIINPIRKCSKAPVQVFHQTCACVFMCVLCPCSFYLRFLTMCIYVLFFLVCVLKGMTCPCMYLGVCVCVCVCVLFRSGA